MFLSRIEIFHKNEETFHLCIEIFLYKIEMFLIWEANCFFQKKCSLFFMKTKMLKGDLFILLEPQ
jgi:hypothetical protein